MTISGCLCRGLGAGGERGKPEPCQGALTQSLRGDGGGRWDFWDHWQVKDLQVLSVSGFECDSDFV